MQKHPRLSHERVRTMLSRVLEPAVLGPASPLEVAAHHVRGEPIAVEDALRAAYEPFSVGDEWGGAWDTTWFRLSGSVPAEWAGHEVVSRVQFGFARRPGYGAEGMAWIDGRPVQGLTRNHTELPLLASAAGGEAIAFHVEAAANPVTQMGWGRQMLMPDPDAPALYRLSLADIACLNRRVADFTHDFRVLLGLLDELPRDDARWWEILTAMNASCNELDPDDVAGTVGAASAPLEEMLSRRATSSAHRVSAVGHAHIDSAWLWPIRETIRKCGRTFATAVTLMDEFPEYRFVCSQAQQYAWTKQHYPHIWERIREKVRDGQWEPVGSMWVEPDCNVPSGESLVRQLVHGKLFFSEELGYETHDVWLPDAFGYSGAMPQLLAQAGCRFFLSQKLSWNDTNQFPHHTFWWEGIDGTRVLAHFPPANTYNGEFTVRELVRGPRNFRDHGRSTRSLYIYGYGDGGGGPTREMLETARRVGDVEGLPRVELEPAREFFTKAADEASDLGVWQGELYNEFHRGTYTSQARVKLGNRRSENLLRDAELWSAAAGLAQYPAAELDEAWKLLLLNQFHDILPGSSIHWVYQDAAADFARIESIATAARDAATTSIAADVDTAGLSRPVVVFNGLLHDRSEVIDVDGVPRHVQVPGCGYAAVDLDAPWDVPEPVLSGDTWMSNGLLRVEWDENGLLTSITDRATGREVLAHGERGNVFQVFRDMPIEWDAWDVDAYSLERHDDLEAVEDIEVVERHALRASVRFVRSFGSSRISQTMQLCAGSRLLTFVTDVDWHETHRLLKVAFPVSVRSPRATYEIQYGHVERATHTNTSWDLAKFEVPAHAWADLSEAGYGVALLNDCKYGYDIRGHVMRLSLLKAPIWPDPEADRGGHRFTYALLPHVGDFRESYVIEQAHALNAPLHVVSVEASGGTRDRAASLVRADPRSIAVSAVKRAERSDHLVVRVYESWGGRGAASVRVAWPVSRAWRVDLLEREIDELDVVAGEVVIDMRPFEVVTLKFELA